MGLSQSHFGKFVALKVLRYGDKQSDIPLFLSELLGNFRSLLKHKEGVQVVDFFWSLVASPAQKAQVFEEFLGPSYTLGKDSFLSSHAQSKGTTPPSALKVETVFSHLLATGEYDTFDRIISSLGDYISAFFSKEGVIVTPSLLHSLLFLYCKHAPIAPLSEVIGMIHERVIEMIHTKDGMMVGWTCASLASAKQRKVMVKSMKKYVLKVATEEFGHMFLMKMLEVTDDSKLMGKGGMELRKVI